MASHLHSSPKDDKLVLGPGANTVVIAGAVVGLLGLVATYLTAGSDGRHGLFAYLMAWAFFLSFSVGGLFFVLIHYVTRAGWSVAVRRVPEALSKVFPLMLLLSVPILLSISQHDARLYRWSVNPPKEGQHQAEDAHNTPENASTTGHPDTDAHANESDSTGKPVAAGVRRPNNFDYSIASPKPLEDGKPEAPDELVLGKLENPFLLGAKNVIPRSGIALLALTLVAWWYAAKSAQQDKLSDTSASLEITRKLNVRAAPALVIFGLAVTFVAFDLLMSLDPVWISTIFGGYYFAGSVLVMYASTILILQFLQAQGYLKCSIRRDHYHDLSKMQFAFTFFWGYLAFSQFMLLWYSSQPEELTWLARRGASTASIHLHDFGAWTWVSMILLFGKLLVPFAGLLSRHVKRAAAGRMFWAVWIIVFHFVDIFWVVMPEYTGDFVFGLTEIAAVLGVGGLFVAAFTWALKGAALRPLKDPRSEESLAFQQSF